jgi:hypothetical protein
MGRLKKTKKKKPAKKVQGSVHSSKVPKGAGSEQKSANRRFKSVGNKQPQHEILGKYQTRAFMAKQKNAATAPTSAAKEQKPPPKKPSTKKRPTKKARTEKQEVTTTTTQSLASDKARAIDDALAAQIEAQKGEKEQKEPAQQGTKRKRTSEANRLAADAQSFMAQKKPKGPFDPVSGMERGTKWMWVSDLEFDVPVGGEMVNVPPHTLHQINTASERQVFHGGYTIVTNDKKVIHGPKQKWNPTEDEHTEPQYFAWLKGKLEDDKALRNAKMLILEVNQTNTPCSGKNCRPKVLTEWLKVGGNVTTVARMSAYQVYESSPPKVQLTGDKAKLHAKEGTKKQTVSTSLVIHKIPEKQVE